MRPRTPAFDVFDEPPPQAKDGQRVFVHPLSMKCLLHHHGGYLRLPQVAPPPSLSSLQSVGQ